MMPVPNERPRLEALPGGKAAGARHTGPSDEELLAGLERGDGAVAGALYDRLIGPVDRAVVRVFGRREQDHDDMVQSAFEQIVLTLSRRRFARACSLATWASSIASHVALNALRSRRRERRVLAGMDDERGADSEVHPIDTERRLGARDDVQRLREELAAMIPERAEALFLHDVLGHELAEIAVILGISVAAAQSRLVRGRKDLLERLAADKEKR
jgi:RNA polymerase sigma-70 factor (ECF subfamily)